MEFLKKNKRFSFKLDGVDAFETDHSVNTMEKGTAFVTEYVFGGTLKLTNSARKIEKFSAYEWVNRFENISDKNSGMVSELYDVDFILPWEHTDVRGRTPWQAKAEEHTTVHATRGSNSGFVDFSDEERLIFPGNTFSYSSIGGRSTDGYAPYFNIHKNGHGLIFGLGWSGQWRASIELGCDEIKIKAKIEDTDFFILPKESFRTLSITMMEYDGTVADGQNLWRSLLKEEYSKTLTRVGNLPICASFWGGLESDEVIKRINLFADSKAPFTHIWMDAGWCGIDTDPTFDEFTGNWYEKVGDWRISSKIHPNGLKDVAKAAHDRGFKFILWFEPERAKLSSPVVSEHPEYFLSDEGSNKLVNLGNPEAYEYITSTVFKMIDRIGIDCYRQDFNFRPLPFWRANDPEHRRGMTEILHINALYRFFDEMLERFPNLIIDNCASGGRRLDMELMKRSFPLWRSDAQCPADPTPEFTQVNNVNFSRWLPYTGTGCGRLYDDYLMRSSYASGMGSNFGFSKHDVFYDEEWKLAWIKKRIEELHSVRKYFAGDLYMLTAPTVDNTAWCASQWHLSDTDEGMIQIFKRSESPYIEASFALSGIDDEKLYEVKDLDGDSTLISGAELKRGFSVTISERRVAKIYIYKAQ